MLSPSLEHCCGSDWEGHEIRWDHLAEGRGHVDGLATVDVDLGALANEHRKNLPRQPG